MLLCIRKIKLFTVLLISLGCAVVVGGATRMVLVPTDNFDYKVFVAGIGTVCGKWSENTGVAVIGLETRPAEEEGHELKVMDLLVANGGSAPITFNPDITLVSQWGERFGISAQGQPEVVVRPGALSQGTVIISVPKGVPDSEWVIEIKGGNIKEEIMLPLRVVKIVEGESDEAISDQ